VKEIAIIKIRNDVPDAELAGRYVEYMGQRVGRKSIAVKFANEHGLRYYPREFLDMSVKMVGQSSDLDAFPHGGERKGHHLYKGHGRYTFTEDDMASPLFGQF
jgi:hypothetical protein